MAPLLELRGISKAFPGVQALTEVDLELRAGEVHAVMGENGAGKSTLMKVVGGVHAPDAGTVLLEGEPVRLRDPIDAQEHGIAVIHQELAVLDDLDVGRNVMLGREPTRAGGLVDWRRLHEQARAALDELGIDLDTRTPVERISVGAKQMVEIARAASRDPRVLVLDEPTSSLGRHEEQALFDLVGRLRARGVGLLYISHRIEEVFRLADRVTVLRDGRHVATRPASDLTRDELVRLMVGRMLADRDLREGAPQPGPVVLEARGLGRGDAVRDVSLELRAGEVLGVAGLVGAGRTELARLLFGADRPDRGEVLLDGRPLRLRSPRAAMRAGIAYVPEDRKALGLVLEHPVGQNIVLSTLRRHTRLGVLRRGSLRRTEREWIERLRIRTPSPRQVAEALSGGNQQKVVLAKALALRPRVLILDEPTRGVDVGAKAELHRLIREAARDGMAVMMISSELPEVLGVSDRILVLHQGRVAGELPAEGATEEEVVALAFGPREAQAA